MCTCKVPVLASGCTNTVSSTAALLFFHSTRVTVVIPDTMITQLILLQTLVGGICKALSTFQRGGMMK